MNPICSKAHITIFTAALVWALVGQAAGQNTIASIPIPTTSIGQVAVNPVLNKIYAGGDPTASAASLTVIDGVTFTVVKTIAPSAGVSVDMKRDNIWTGTLAAGDVEVYAGNNNVEIFSTQIGSCPAAVSFDCRGRMWVAAECGKKNDSVWVFETDNFKLIDGPISSGGTITQPPVANPRTGKLYVTSGGVSEEIDPTTFKVSNTTFGTVLAIDSATNRLYATSGNNLQVILGNSEAILKTVNLNYTPPAVGVNNALGHVYVANPAGNSIDVYNQNGIKLTSFLLGADNQPGNLAVDSARGRLYVDVLNTGTGSWSLDVIEDLSSVRQCEFPGSCDY
jgi:DNA-binding beta-propeller fold protein YncE